jgi:hypothetical protein
MSSAFVLRHSKLVRRDHLTAVAVAAQSSVCSVLGSARRRLRFERLTERHAPYPIRLPCLSAGTRASGCGHLVALRRLQPSFFVSPR